VAVEVVGIGTDVLAANYMFNSPSVGNLELSNGRIVQPRFSAIGTNAALPMRFVDLDVALAIARCGGILAEPRRALLTYNRQYGLVWEISSDNLAKHPFIVSAVGPPSGPGVPKIRACWRSRSMN
jgi:hypothetical protein